MNTAHASLLQWLQEHPDYRFECYKRFSWSCYVSQIGSKHMRALGFGASYEAACHNLMTQLRKIEENRSIGVARNEITD